MPRPTLAAEAHTVTATFELLIDDELAVDDGVTLYVEVRHFSGGSATPWTLQITGNATLALTIPNCD